MNLKQLRQVIIREFNKLKDKNKDAWGIAYTTALAVLFYVSGILGILDYFIIKILLFLALPFLLVYCILIMVQNKNHPD
jgi:hypothetical protein